MGSLCVKNRKDDTDMHGVVAFDHKYKGVIFQDVGGDICDEDVNAIVNPANSHLSHRAGLSNELVTKGGEIIQQESDEQFQKFGDEALSAGTVVVTSAGSLKAKYILHMVSPVWTGGDQHEEEKLSRGVQNALIKADELGVTSIALPSLSGGIFGFGKAKCAEIMVKKAMEYIEANETRTKIKVIKFVNTDNTAVKALKKELDRKISGKIVAFSEMSSRQVSLGVKGISEEQLVFKSGFRTSLDPDLTDCNTTD